MPSLDWAGAIAEGHSPQEIVDYAQQRGIPFEGKLPPQITQYLKGIQYGAEGGVPAAVRPYLMTGSEILSGLGEVGSIPARLMGLQGPSILQQAGAINNPHLVPGLGANPVAENILAGGARGFGAGLPMAAFGPTGAMGTLASAAGGVIGAGLEQLAPGLPRWVPAAAGATVGLLGGGIGEAIGGAIGKAIAPAVPTAADFLSNAITTLGGTKLGPGGWGTTYKSVGQEIKNELAANKMLSSASPPLAAPTALETGLRDKYLTMKPAAVSRDLLGNENALQVLRDENPELANKLGAANINLGGWTKLGDKTEIKDLLIDDDALKFGVENAFKQPAATTGKARSLTSQITEPLGLTLAGELAGSMIGHYLIPGMGDYIGGTLGGMAALSGDMALRHGAQMVLDPVIRNAGFGTGLGAYVGANPPVQ